jgi:hypothetical protein
MVNGLNLNKGFLNVFGGIEICPSQPRSAVGVVLGRLFRSYSVCNSFYKSFFLLAPLCGDGLRPWSFAPGRPPEGLLMKIYSTGNVEEPNKVAFVTVFGISHGFARMCRGTLGSRHTLSIFYLQFPILLIINVFRLVQRLSGIPYL